METVKVILKSNIIHDKEVCLSGSVIETTKEFAKYITGMKQAEYFEEKIVGEEVKLNNNSKEEQKEVTNKEEVLKVTKRESKGKK